MYRPQLRPIPFRSRLARLVPAGRLPALLLLILACWGMWAVNAAAQEGEDGSEDTTSGGMVQSINTSTTGARAPTVQFSLTSINSNPRAIAVTADRVYVTDDADVRVYVYTHAGTRIASEEFVFGNTPNPHGLHVYDASSTNTPDYKLLVGDGAEDGNHQIDRYDISSGDFEASIDATVGGNSGANPSGVTRDEFGQYPYIYYADWTDSAVYRSNIAGTTYGHWFNMPTGTTRAHGVAHSDVAAELFVTGRLSTNESRSTLHKFSSAGTNLGAVSHTITSRILGLSVHNGVLWAVTKSRTAEDVLTPQLDQTATAQANQTATAQAQATETAEALVDQAGTATAIAQQTATAQAIASLTAVVQATETATAQLTFDSFDTTGLDPFVLALIQTDDSIENIGAYKELYNLSGNEGVVQPNSDLDLLDGWGIVRIRANPSNGQVLINTESGPSQSTFWNAEGIDLTLHIVTQGGHVQAARTGNIVASGGGYSRWQLPVDARQDFTDIGPNENFIIAFTEPVDVSATQTAIAALTQTAVAQNAATQTAVAQLTATAQAQATETAVAQNQLTQTAVAQITQTALAQVQMTQTAVAQQTATAQAQLTQTAIAQTTATAAAMQTAEAALVLTAMADSNAAMTATAQAELTATAAAIATETAEALSSENMMTAEAMQTAEAAVALTAQAQTSDNQTATAIAGLTVTAQAVLDLTATAVAVLSATPTPSPSITPTPGGPPALGISTPMPSTDTWFDPFVQIAGGESDAQKGFLYLLFGTTATIVVLIVVVMLTGSAKAGLVISGIVLGALTSPGLGIFSVGLVVVYFLGGLALLSSGGGD